jgi:hypothetical protein
MGVREDRIEENEKTFRAANDQLLEEWDDMQLARSRDVLFICECGDAACRQPMRMTIAEYEALREGDNTFAIVPGHLVAASEHLVGENERFATVKKQ